MSVLFIAVFLVPPNKLAALKKGLHFNERDSDYINVFILGSKCYDEK